ARRDTPLDLPRTSSGAIDMTLVQPGFVYKAKDGVLFMVDPARKKFAEARKLLKPNAEGRSYEPIPDQLPLQLLDERGRPRPAGQILTETYGLIRRSGKRVAEQRMMKKAAHALSAASRGARKLYGEFKRLDFEAPDSPAAHTAQDKYLEAWKTLREKEESFRKMLSPENVGGREMMFRVEGRGPAVTHELPMTGDGQIDARNLEKGKIYEVEDGRYFQFDEDGEDFVEMRRLGKSDEHGRAFAPIPDQQSTSLTTDLRASQGGYGPSIVPQPLKLTDKFGNILPPNEIEVAAKTLAEQAGRGGYQATVIGTRAREAAEFKRRLDEALSSASRSGIDPNRDPAILRLKNAYRREIKHLRGLRDEFLEEIKPEMVSIEAMPERADDPGRLGHAGNRSLRTIGEFGAIPGEAWATQRARNARTWKGYFDRIDAGEDPRSVWKRIGDRTMRSIILEYFKYPELREQSRKKYVPYLDPRASEIYQMSQEWRDILETNTPLNKRFEGDYFTDVLPDVLANAATKTTISVALGAVGVPLPATLAMLGMIDESSTQFRAALERGVPLDEAYEVFGFAGFVGLAEGLPVANILQKLNVATGGMANGLLWEAFKGLAEGRAIEEVKAALTENINKGLEEANKLELASDAEINAATVSNGVAHLVLTMLGRDD
ncbi:MAG: hypothetical protein OEZ03_11855, partial [Alphaproteobacteria bacterium]|nr:hypothetical protein [Alphaproteobacteria bacterium]